jgi:hypothetical protein
MADGAGSSSHGAPNQSLSDIFVVFYRMVPCCTVANVPSPMEKVGAFPCLRRSDGRRALCD